MKRIYSIIAVVVIGLMSMAATIYDVAPHSSTSNSVTQLSNDDSWILIGEITLSNYYNSNETIQADLYVIELGNSLIYRVGYNGSYYATRWHDYSQTYHVTINGTTYRCDVPAISDGAKSESSTGLQRFVGVWKPLGTSSLIGDIKISIQENKLFVQVKTGNNAEILSSTYAQVEGDLIRWTSSTDEYGEWSLGYTGTGNGYYIQGDGYGYNLDYSDREWVKRESSHTTANRERLQFYYTARLSNGNLVVDEEYQYFYYKDSYSKNIEVFKTSRKNLGNATYTQW